MQNPVHVLHITTHLGTGGVQSFLVNYAQNINTKKVVFDVAVQTTEPQRYDDVIESAGGMIYPVRLMTKSPIGFFLDIYKICKQHPEIQIVHSHLNYRNFLALFATKCANVPIRISHSHSAYEAKNKAKELARWIYQFLLPLFATDYWGCSEKANQWLYGTKRQNTVVIHNCIDAEKYRFNLSVRDRKRTSLNLTENDLVLVHVGTFGDAKNHMFLLRMFAKYLEKHESANLILCGDGPNRKKIESEIQRLKIGPNVKMLGMVHNIEEILIASDVFVLPSLYEGLPLSAVEAQASGLACVVSAAVPEEAIFMRNCCVCDQFDSDKWIDLIDKVYNMSMDRGAGYKLAKEAGFDILSETQRLEKLYTCREGK